ncbi:MAG: hypothetical protein E7588_00550 [Ruminococcaceae bacterium]|nr:hypothetical protein [Oscillospiraceae bacterium]
MNIQKNSGNKLLLLPDGQNPLVHVNIKYPLSGDEKIDKYIVNIVSGLEKFARKKLVKRAKKFYGNLQSAQPFSLVATFRVTLDNEKLFCFYLDAFVWQGSGRSVVKRIPLNFDRTVSSLIFPLEKRKRRELTGNLRVALSTMVYDKAYYSDCHKRALRYLRKNNAVISRDGIYLTYNSGILAPHDRGAVSILLFPLRN